MNLNNIATGMTIKNYKELCTLLEVKEKGGKAKQLQLQEIQSYIHLQKDKHKYIVKEIYNTQQKAIKIDNKRNNIEYINIIAILISDLLAKDTNNGKVFLSKNKLLKELKMINDNYAFCKQRIFKLAKYTNIEADTIEEWYDSTDSTLKRNIEKALDNLRQESLIIWSSEITICKINVQGYNKFTNNFNINKTITIDKYDEKITEYEVKNNILYDIREATDEEKRHIIYTEHEVLKDLECKNKQEVIRLGKWEEFKEKVNNIILQNLNIAFYYDSYKILYNEEHICQKYENLIDLLLSDEERKEYYKDLNNNIKDRIRNNIKRRQSKAYKDLELDLDLLIQNNNISRRISSNYINDNENLTNLLIDINSKNIINKIKTTKL